MFRPWLVNLRLQKKYILRTFTNVIAVKTIAIIGLTMLTAASGLAQDQRLGISGHGARGILLPHRQSMGHLPDGSAAFGELRLFAQCAPNEPWKKLYRQPQIGVSNRFFDLANDQLLGYGIAVAAFFSSPVVVRDRLIWHLELGAGPGIVTKPFDTETNYKNIAIGSYGNAFIMLGQRISMSVSPKLDVELAASFNHFSNAAFTLPNLGVNYPMVSAGISYHPSRLQENVEDSSQTRTEISKVRNAWLIGLSGGFKQSPKPYRQKAPTMSLTGDRLWGLSRKSSLSLGTDVFYNAALYNFRQAVGESIHPVENIRLGFHLGYGMHIDRATILLQMGGYAYDSFKQDGFLYNRVGIRYFMGQHLAMNLTLKTHLFKADFFELGVTYRI